MSLGDIELPALVFAVVANLSLVVIVLRYAPKNQSRMLFILLVLSQTIWTMVNFFAIRGSSDQVLNMARWTIVAAVPHPLLFFLFISAFLKTKQVLKLHHGVLSIALVFIISVIARSSLLFSHLEIKAEGPTPVAGPGMAVFGIYTAFFIVMTLFSLTRSWRRSKGLERVQWRFVGIGLITTVVMISVFNFFVPVFFENVSLVRLGHLYTLPFVAFTAYAMIRHQLLNIKAITAELTSILLGFIVFIQLFNSQSLGQFIVSFIVLLGVALFGVLIVRGVIKEVQQREELQKLTERLKVTNEKLESANARLKELDQAKTEFLSITSHQLRTPMTGIKGYLSMVLDGDYGELPKAQAEVIKIVASEVDRLSRLVQVFLNVSRIESGRLLISKSTFNLNDLISSVVKELQLVAEAKSVKVKHEHPSGAVEIAGDRDKLNDVVINLVDNAIKYTSAGTVSVEAVSDKEGVGIDVRDTGVGIDPEEAGRLFEKFSRGKGAAEAAPGGTGLGLFIVKKIVEAHGGRAWAKSSGRGKGSVFSFRIPVSH